MRSPPDQRLWLSPPTLEAAKESPGEEFPLASAIGKVFGRSSFSALSR
jgi:hypothetical protein